MDPEPEELLSPPGQPEVADAPPEHHARPSPLLADTTEGEPDRYERGIRLGCGALFGLVVGFLASRSLWRHSSVAPFVLALFSAALAALFARRLGDDFWRGSLIFIGAIVVIALIVTCLLGATVHDR